MYVTDNDRKGLRHRFDWCGDSMISSYFEGIIGTGVAERRDDPRWMLIRSGDFYFAAGEPVGIDEAVRDFILPHSVIIPEDMKWLEAVQACGLEAGPYTRYRTRIPEKGLNRALLESYLQNAGCVTVKRAGEREYALLRDCEWENAFVFNFSGMEDFLTNGFAWCVFIGDELASAASTYGWYSGGYELQIATAPKFRRRGLAAVSGAAFLLECLDRGKRPHWDAANETSVRIAQRLGFEYAGEYQAISVK